jgi:hypothetical protein
LIGRDPSVRVCTVMGPGIGAFVVVAARGVGSRLAEPESSRIGGYGVALADARMSPDGAPAVVRSFWKVLRASGTGPRDSFAVAIVGKGRVGEINVLRRGDGEATISCNRGDASCCSGGCGSGPDCEASSTAMMKSSSRPEPSITVGEDFRPDRESAPTSAESTTTSAILDVFGESSAWRKIRNAARPRFDSARKRSSGRFSTWVDPHRDHVRGSR